jgi:NAD(P)-dependent dehydrogenase (short-subunit alcohol dehydrogenase family)
MEHSSEITKTTKTPRVAIVSGGSRGIGAAVVGALTAAGYVTIFNYLKQDARAIEVTERCSGAIGIRADVRQLKHIEALAEKAIHDFGRIDVLVNCAGIVMDRIAHKMSEEEWSEVLHTNLFGVFNMVRCILPHMRKQRYGRIISIASIIGQSGNIGQANYAASKAGIVGFTKSVALENAAVGITANVISPGFTETDMLDTVPSPLRESIKTSIPMQRFGRVSEIAALVEFLCSPEAGYITGQEIGVNGGLYM